VRARSSFCPSCGLARSAPVIELERHDLPRPVDPGSEPAVVTTEGGPTGLGRRLLGVVGGVGVLGLLVVALASGGGEGGEEAAATTTEVPATTTTDQSPSSYSTLPLGATYPPATTAAPTVPASTIATTTSIPFVNQRRGPVLGAATGGWSLYVRNGDGIRRVDLDTGTVQIVSMPQAAGGAYRMVQAGDKFVVSGGLGTYLVGPDFSGATVQLSENSAQQLVGVTESGDRFWFISYPQTGGRATGLRLVDTRGRTVAALNLSSDNGAYPAGVVGDRLVLQGPGRIFTMDASGRILPYANGQIVAANGRFVLWIGCDDRARCTYKLGDATTPDTDRTSLETGYLAAGAGGEFTSDPLAPDGATVIAGVTRQDQQRFEMHIVDLATGSVLEADRPITSSAVWSPDGAWVFRGSVAGIDAVSVRTGRVVQIDVPGLVITNGTGVLAVG
jgi:hypothetical protein